MKPLRGIALVVTIAAMAGCSANPTSGRPEESTPRSSTSETSGQDADSAATTVIDDATSSTAVVGVFTPAVDPEVEFVGQFEESSGSLVVRYEPNSWYDESGIAELPSVGDLKWFLDTEAGCLAVDRARFLDAMRVGQEITLTPAPGGEISIGESLPLWIEGDWLIHDGCSKGDPIVHQEE